MRVGDRRPDTLWRRTASALHQLIANYLMSFQIKEGALCLLLGR